MDRASEEHDPVEPSACGDLAFPAASLEAQKEKLSGFKSPWKGVTMFGTTTHNRVSRWRIAGGVAVLPLTVLLAACGSSATPGASSSSPSTVPKTSYTIGFSNPQGTQPVLNNFQQALTEAANREGIKVTSLNAALSVNNQVSDIQQFINEKVNAIVVFPLAGPPLVPVLTAARKAGIAVLGYNAITSGASTASAIYPYSADLNQGLIHQGAQLAAAYVAKQLHGKGNVLGVGIAAPVPALRVHERRAGSGHHGTLWYPLARNGRRPKR